MSNTQIEWILGDDDVSAFFTKIANQYAESIDPGLLAEFWEQFEPDYGGDEEDET